MKIIFLDIDGVLNSSNYFEEIDFESNMETAVPIDPKSVACLKRIVDATEARIVLTSSWRGGWEKDPDECYQEGFILNQELGKCGLSIYDKTIYDDGYGAGTRAREVKQWLQNSPEKVESFLIIDDNDYDWHKFGLKKRWFQTDFLTGGLGESHVKPCIRILKKRRFILF